MANGKILDKVKGTDSAKAGEETKPKPKFKSKSKPKQMPKVKPT